MYKQDDQNFWNFIYSVFFLIVTSGLLYFLYETNGGLPTEISFFDLSIVILASFRLTRLFVYDKITHFIRDFFTVTEERYTEEGVTYFIQKEYVSGPGRTAYDLLTCPWCFSVWASVFTLFFYFLTPLSWLPICILAVSGVATIIQLIANAIGWNAENAKIKAKQNNID